MVRSPLSVVRVMYLSLFGAGGAWVPYMMVFMADAGLSDRAAGLTYAAMSAARVLGGPLWGGVADRLRRDTTLIRVGSLLAAATGAVALGAPAVVLPVVLVLHDLSKSGLGALTDASAVRGLSDVGRPPTEYGRLRLWGSVGYLGVGLLVGAVSDVTGSKTGLACALFLWLFAAWQAGGLPDGRRGPPVPVWPAMREAARRPAVLLILLAAVLHGTTLAAYDTLYAVHIRELGLPSSWVGWALAVGIGCELAVLYAGPRMIRRPLLLVGTGMVAATVRWTALVFVRDPVWLTALQALHALAYAAWWIGSMEALRRLVPETLRASTAAALTASGYGLGPMGCGVLAGVLVEDHGAVAVFAVGIGLSGTAAALIALAAWAARAPLTSPRTAPGGQTG